jgi:hypothetical protein
MHNAQIQNQISNPISICSLIFANRRFMHSKYAQCAESKPKSTHWLGFAVQNHSGIITTCRHETKNSDSGDTFVFTLCNFFCDNSHMFHMEHIHEH